MKRRDFLKHSLVVIAGAAVPATALDWLNPKEVLASTPDLRWIFLVNTHKCVGCGFCVKACKEENEIPHEANVTRTWVERYIITKQGEVHIDSPGGARDGFISGNIFKGQTSELESKVEVLQGRQEGSGPLRRDRWENLRDDEIAQAFFVPKLCNQCEHPACVQVCPVGATYQADDGVVLVDRKWCIGCGYCIMGCPYGVRFFHPTAHVPDKCNFCYHRIHHDQKTACVTACPFGARQIGNLSDTDDPVTRVVLSQRVGVLRDEYGTKPQVFYLGLNKEVR